MNQLRIVNSGQHLTHTNFWYSDNAKSGFLFLTYNAGAARLLIPQSSESFIEEMKTAKYVTITRGFWPEQRREAIELLFEDHTDSPFVTTMVAEQCDRMLPDADRGRRFPFLVYTSDGLVHETEGRYRRVPKLPCLKPWR